MIDDSSNHMLEDTTLMLSGDGPYIRTIRRFLSQRHHSLYTILHVLQRLFDIQRQCQQTQVIENSEYSSNDGIWDVFDQLESEITLEPHSCSNTNVQALKTFLNDAVYRLTTEKHQTIEKGNKQDNKCTGHCNHGDGYLVLQMELKTETAKTDVKKSLRGKRGPDRVSQRQRKIIYTHPTDAQVTWRGRGRPPLWVKKIMGN